MSAVADVESDISHVLSSSLDRSSYVPLYHQVAEAIQQAIHSGQLRSGTLLGNEAKLADSIGLSRVTMRRALQELVEHGLVVRKRGVGTAVVPVQTGPLRVVPGSTDDAGGCGRRATTTLLDYRVGPADDEVASTLGVRRGASVTSIHRLRLIAGEPIALMTNLLRADLAPTADQIEQGGLRSCLERRGINVRVARQCVGARLATQREADVFGEATPTAVLTVDRTAYDDGGWAVDMARYTYRASQYTFSTTEVSR